MPTAPTIQLSSGHKIPVVGLGTYNTFEDRRGQIRKAVECAIDCGYRHIDCAWLYGNESEVGEAIAAKAKEGVVKREDIFITDKLWCSFHNPKDVKPALMETLKALQTDYVDLYLIHWPFAYQNNGEKFPEKDGKLLADNIDYVETWKAMEGLMKEGLAKSIGISNFNTFQVKRVLDSCTIRPAVNQVELQPYLMQPELVDLCKKNDIVLTAYSPLGSPNSLWQAGDYPVPLEEPIIKDIASRLNKGPAQVILKYLIQNGLSVVPKSATPSRILANIDLFNFELSKDDMEKIASLASRKHRINWVELDKQHKYFPFVENYSE